MRIILVGQSDLLMLTKNMDFRLGEAKLGVRDGSRKGGHVCNLPHMFGEGEEVWRNCIAKREEEVFIKRITR